MPISHSTYMRKTVVSSGRAIRIKIADMLMRARECQDSDAPIAAEIMAIVESMEHQWLSIANWLVYEHNHPSPDPATATVDWPYPPQCLDHMRDILMQLRELTSTLQESHNNWSRHNRELAEWRQGERDKEDRRFEQSVITSMYLPMEASDELVNRLRDVTGHEERMRIIRAMQEERGPVEHKIYTPGISIQERVEAAITARLAGARGDEE